MKISNPTALLGEDLATEYLKKNRYKLIERNYRKSYTEIDIICTKSNILVFVEVKTRTNEKYGTPFEGISRKKLQNLIKTAQYYSQSNPKLPKSLRIDAISVLIDENKGTYKLEHLENITL